MEEAMISASNIIREFPAGGQKVRALNGVSLDVEQGTLTVLRGRSGSGKTTLLNILGALDYPTSGRILFEGRDITALSDGKRDTLRRSRLGFVFQSVALMSHMTAYENVEFALRIAGEKKNRMRERAMECLALVGLSKRVHHLPQELSGGEQQRVAIARAIAHRPPVILADEPTAELDTAMGIQVVKIFKTLIEKEGVTVIMTTHDVKMAEIADRVFTLEDGELID